MVLLFTNDHFLLLSSKRTQTQEISRNNDKCKEDQTDKRKYDNEFTHVIFMDDDVSFENSCFYILFDFLRTEEEIYKKRPVAGRMIDKDNPTIQWTAAEKWNGGDIQHVERQMYDKVKKYTKDIASLKNKM